jgi:alkylated DNA repair dioxygenase AlkB
MGEQLRLFAPHASGPSGLRYQPEFISASDEHDLIGRIEALPLAPFQFGAFEGKRRVASFGWRYDYTDKKLLAANPIPDWLAPTIRAVEAFADLPAGAIRQTLFTKYEAGVGIGWHRDKPHFSTVCGLSLGSTCRLRLRRRNGPKWERFTLEAQPRSIYTLASDARHIWEHSIPPVDETRYSITFRAMAERS